MTQTQQIATYLKKGHSLTSIDALEKFGVFRLAARVKDLRDQGLKIHSVWVERGDKRFARYYMT
jgi:hypothetical protein